MVTAQQNLNSSFEDDFLKVGPGALATFDNPRRNPTEHAGSESLRVLKIDDDFEDEELDDEDDEDEDEEVEEDDDEDEDDDDDDDEDEDDDDEEDDDLAKGPRVPSIYHKL